MEWISLAHPKPAFGEPCNGCGLCCLAEPCPVAKEMLGETTGPCRALEFEDGRYWCGLIRGAHRHVAGLEEKPWAGHVIRNMLLATGAWRGGCDSEDPAP
jgi:hypothetical protein